MSRRIPPIKNLFGYKTISNPPKDNTIFISYSISTELLSLPSRRLECYGLYMVYFSFLRWEGRIPTILELQKLLGIGRDRILATRKVLIENGIIETSATKGKGTRTRIRLDPKYTKTVSSKHMFL